MTWTTDRTRRGLGRGRLQADANATDADRRHEAADTPSAMERRAMPARSEALIAAAGFLLATLALIVGFSADQLGALEVVRALAYAAGIAVPVAAGLYAMHREQTFRFGRLLVIGGFAWAPLLLATSSSSVPYSIGRVWAWGVLAWLVYLMLAFPLGKLTTRTDRWIFGFALAVTGLLYVPTALFADFPVPSPWAECEIDCPPNAFLVTHDPPAFVHSIVSVRDVVTSVLYMLAALTVALRWTRGSGTAKRVHGPVLALALANFLVASAFVVARRLQPEADATETIGLAALLGTPALAAGFLAGLVRWRVVAATTWRRIASPGERALSHDRLCEVLAAAVKDPSLEIGYWGGDTRAWIDENGLAFPLPPRGTGRAATEIVGAGGRLAVLVHEDGYLADSAIREIVQGVALLALDNHRIEAEAAAALRELSDSRSRIVAAIDRDRLRVERDLHDGAQQRLIALKVAADRGATSAGADSVELAAMFERIGAEASAALDEVRALARGVYPSLLVDHGLVAALEDAARRASIPARVRSRGVRRYPQEIEATVYFCCLEAMQNAEKHSGATSVTIDLRGNGALSFEVRDNGRGFVVGQVQGGAGLGNLKDRTAAVGGELRIDSVPAGGTRVSGHVPMLPDRVPQEVERLVLRAADALEDALGIYRAVRTSSGNVVDFVVEHVNDAAVAMTGIARDNQVGKTLGQLQPGYHRSEAFRWHCQALESSTPLVREDLEYTGGQGRRRLRTAHEVRAVGLGAGRIALVWRDVTDRARAEHDLRLQAEALGQERDGVCIVRAATGTIVYANASLEAMFGYRPGELQGRPASTLDWVESGDGDGTAATQWFGPDRFETKCRRKDGGAIWCEVTINRFEDPDLGWCWVAAHHDKTETHEEELRSTLEREQLGHALQTLRAMAWTADLDLTLTMLFDNLLPAQQGDALAAQIDELNRRVLVTGRSAQVELSIEAGGDKHVLLSARPIRDQDDVLIGISGTAIERSAAQSAAHVSQMGAPARRSLTRRRRAE